MWACNFKKQIVFEKLDIIYFYLKVCSVYPQNVFLEFRNSAQTLHKFVGKPFDENKMQGNSDDLKQNNRQKNYSWKFLFNSGTDVKSF